MKKWSLSKPENWPPEFGEQYEGDVHMENVLGLRCINCGQQLAAEPGIYTCARCGPELGILDVEYDYRAIRKTLTSSALAQSSEHSIFRYLPLLPIQPAVHRPCLRVGWTPLYRTERLGRYLGLNQLHVKDDGQNPTASLKDRASVIAVIKAVEEKATTIACSSTGNAASSLAGCAAAYGLETYIFIPRRAPQGKVAQLLIFGANVMSVDGSYEDAYRLSSQAIEYFGWYNRNAAINPYMVEGKKTVAFEIAEQLNWHAPDWVIVSVGDGCTIAGIGKGFSELYQLGFIESLPRLAGIQAQGASPLVEAFQKSRPWQPAAENTLADSIAVGVPRNPEKALRTVRASQGLMLAVGDDEILEAMCDLGRLSGIFGEPAAAAGLAGLKRLAAEGAIKADDRVVMIVTGSGLKDVKNAVAATGNPQVVKPDLEQLIAILKQERSAWKKSM